MKCFLLPVLVGVCTCLCTIKASAQIYATVGTNTTYSGVPLKVFNSDGSVTYYDGIIGHETFSYDAAGYASLQANFDNGIYSWANYFSDFGIDVGDNDNDYADAVAAANFDNFYAGEVIDYEKYYVGEQKVEAPFDAGLSLLLGAGAIAAIRRKRAKMAGI